MVLQKRKLRRAFTFFITFAFSVAFVALIGEGIIRFNNNLLQQQLETVKQSVQNAVIHCYSLEGAYPPNLDYLSKYYGLVVDRTHYIYDYGIFASNVPPVIQIFKKQ